MLKKIEAIMFVLVFALIVSIYAGASAPPKKADPQRIITVAEDSIIYAQIGETVVKLRLPKGCKITVVFEGEEKKESPHG
jgi:hypothetical protein